MVKFPDLEKPIIPFMILRHINDGAFLWEQRMRKIGAPNAYLKDIDNLDKKIECHLYALRIAGAAGWRLAKSELESTQGNGECFIATVSALNHPIALDCVREVMGLAANNKSLKNALYAALAWSHNGNVPHLLSNALGTQDIELQALAIAVMRMRRDMLIISKATFNQALVSVGELQLQAVRAVGEMGLQQYASFLYELLRDTSDSTRQYWSAYSLLLLGDRTLALEHLTSLLLAGGHTDEENLLQMVMRTCDLQFALDLIQRWISENRIKYAITACGILGVPICVVWLLSVMQKPEFSKQAFVAFSQITGLNFEDPNFHDASILNDEDSFDEVDFFQPNLPAVMAWWQQNSVLFDEQKCYLMGREQSVQSRQNALARGTQYIRQGAALDAVFCNDSPFLININGRVLDGK